MPVEVDKWHYPISNNTNQAFIFIQSYFMVSLFEYGYIN
ncbi:hypothetical protein [uncultured Gammaproteobacteria bacterium]|nr:hypothetical protein BROOK1789C_1110 [Bathymodiolus brooksi thiotrophic gill symbiont]CAC9524751.1 hypothetical protein [uncultured Gammaproteobacteria bacterium]CAC9551605.1 hypothetical protein [uncultured Gammaproteobacteria bacterium]CAC9553834.1 hypothetical protein [uncultured Gammaproteobacteria bacterium]CAC9560264.1 hypothetical protein [uncultured Gammaproteobacteria bacterium]